MKKLVIGALALLILILTAIPFETTFVPEWKLRVVDEFGVPYKKQLVREFCNNYTLGIHPCEGKDDTDKLTDENGYVVFPERVIRASLIFRIVRFFIAFLLFFVNGEYGEQVYVDSSGPKGHAELRFVPGTPLPEVFVLASENHNIGTQN
jgi:hypothetical protein